MIPTLTRPTVSWRVQATPLIAFAFVVVNGAWHWRLDEPNASFSAAHPTYPAAMAEARRRHGLPAIGAGGEHITPAQMKEEEAS